MAQSRDDFIIAIRSALLKRETKQKFSLLSLIILSVIILILSNYNFKVVNIIKSGVSEIVYRTSYAVSVPEKVLDISIQGAGKFISQKSKINELKEELEGYRSKEISLNILKFENKNLKELLDDYLLLDNLSYAKIIIDTKSPYLKSFIINKGTKDGVEKGMVVLDKNFLVGKIIEVNFSTSRVLLLSDINSNIPISIEPGNLQAIATGLGNDFGQVNFLKKIHYNKIKDGSFIYSSGTGGLIKSGIPIGKVIDFEDKEKESDMIKIEFFSDFSQLKYVSVVSFVKKNLNNQSDSIDDLPLEAIEIDQLNEKIKVLLKEKNIEEEIRTKIQQENETLKKQLSDTQRVILDLEGKFVENKIEEEELKFLKLNLEFGHKCRKTFFNDLYEVGTVEYKNCVLSKGKN
tara:strand:- start:1231 stop:2442 length:1212 start_codon:yes stop_codon:yes gene_type:complete